MMSTLRVKPGLASIVPFVFYPGSFHYMDTTCKKKKREKMERGSFVGRGGGLWNSQRQEDQQGKGDKLYFSKSSRRIESASDMNHGNYIATLLNDTAADVSDGSVGDGGGGSDRNTTTVTAATATAAAAPGQVEIVEEEEEEEDEGN
ncbi:hypothetical protein M0804_009200 [Polistes exclamans]|nr:hypothetical protein M0804_009200 [Polistes exclamans]